MTFRVAKAEVRRKFAGIHTGMIAAFADKRFRSKYEDKFTLRATHGTPEDIVEWMKVGIILLLFLFIFVHFKKNMGGAGTRHSEVSRSGDVVVQRDHARRHVDSYFSGRPFMSARGVAGVDGHAQASVTAGTVPRCAARQVPGSDQQHGGPIASPADDRCRHRMSYLLRCPDSIPPTGRHADQEEVSGRCRPV